MAIDVLLINADPHIREQMTRACSHLGASFDAVDDVEAAIPVIDTAPPRIVLLEVEPSAGSGLDAFTRLRERWPRLCIILIAERARSEQAIEAMKRGAIDYLLKPLSHDDLVNHLTNALRISRDMAIPTVYEQDRPDAPVERIIGESHTMHEVFKLIGLIAPRDVNVLITGESGTGKELVARALYHHSGRKERSFLAVNCAAIPETLLESELFGHEKGAFTGADMRRIGKFEQCDGGTLFLDEIGDLPLATQAKLLRVLQDGSFQRLGGTETIRCNVRIIAASNQPLEQLIAERRFREDLYYRLKVTTIDVPPLRERGVDAVLLAHYFVRRYNRQMGTQIQNFAPEVLPVLLSYPWPGNVRELENAIKAALVVARGTVFQLEFLPEKIRHAPRLVPGQRPSATPGVTRDEPAAPASAGDRLTDGTGLREMCRRLAAHGPFHGRVYQEAVEAVEREVIRACLEATGGKLAQTAEMLGITRTTLRRKMGALGIHISTSVTTAARS